MIGARRSLSIALLVASPIILASCNDGLLHAPAPAEPAVVMLRTLVRQTMGGPPEAFDRADRLFLRLKVGDDVRVEQVLAFGASAAGSVRVEVPLRHVSETMTADLELRLGDRPLFRASASPTLKSGEQTPVEFALDPVVDHVTCGTDVVQFTAYGQTAQLGGAALFATEDTVRTVPVTWAVPANTVVSLTAAGNVAALQDGDAEATCTAAGLNAKRSIHVFAVVSSIQVAPSTATLVVGNTLPLSAMLFDARGNVIISTRPLAWSSANSSVATVSAAGVATGVVAGTARINANSGTVTGGSDVTVVSTSTVVSNAVTAITGTSATLLGTVNPRGTTAQSWFEWGTDPTLTTSTATTARSAGSGTADVSVSETIVGLTPLTTYYFRTVASSVGGTVRASILSFSTLRPPSASTLDLSLGATIVVFGSVNPNGSATSAWFQYGASPTLSTFSETAHQSVGNGATAVNVSAGLSGLQPFTTYYVRMVGSGVGGTSVGGILSFTTGGAPSVGAVSGDVPVACIFQAVISSSGNPNGASAEAWIDYSTNANLAGFTSTAHQSLGNGTGSVAFSATVPTSGPASNIYFRAVVSNSFGIVTSSLQAISPPICVK